MVKLKRTIAVVIALALVVAAFAGCGNSSKNTGEAAEKSTAQSSEKTTDGSTGSNAADKWAKWKIGDNVSFNWYVNYTWWQFTKNWEEYPILKEISDITGVTPKVTLLAGDANEKLNLMIATNELPDMITLDQVDPAVKKLVSLGLLYSHDELIEKYAPEFKSEIPEDVYNYSKLDDGKVYGLPSYFIPDWQFKEKFQVGRQTYNVRKDIFKELGSPDMSTPDKFIEALKLFKQKYPSINGKPSIALSLTENVSYRDLPRFSVVERSFGVKDYYEDAGHNLKIAFKDPKYAAVAKFLNRLYREGLMDPGTFIQTKEKVQENISSGRVFAAPATFWTLWEANAALDKTKADSHFIALEPMKAGSKVEFAAVAKPGWTTTMITKNAKNPEALIKFVRFMWNKDGNLLLNYGHEGKDYTIEGDSISPTQSVIDEQNKDWVGWQQNTGINTYRFWIFPYYKAPYREEADRAADRKMADKYSVDESAYAINLQPDPTSPEGIINTQYNETVIKELPKIVMAKSEEDAIKALNEMIAKLDKVGVQKLEAFWTEKYKSNRVKFGLDK